MNFESFAILDESGDSDFEEFFESSETLNGRRNSLLVSDTHIELNLPQNVAMKNFTPSGNLIISSDSGSDNATFSYNDPLTALLESNRLLQEILLTRSKKQKVYVFMPDKFDMRVGDFIEAQLEQFETQFHHREHIEEPIERRMRVETAIQNTKTDISIDLTCYEADYRQWKTQKTFCDYIKATYRSTEFGYIRFIRLQATT